MIWLNFREFIDALPAADLVPADVNNSPLAARCVISGGL